MRPDLKRIILNRIHNDERRSDNSYRDNASDGMYDEAYQDGYNDGYSDGRRNRMGRRKDRHSSDIEEDFEDEHSSKLSLPSKVKAEWLRNLTDKFGNKGPHFGKDEIMHMADKMNVNYNGFTPSDLYLTTNMLYSDCTTFRQTLPKDKEIWHWVSAAVEWLEDSDSSLKGSEKLVSHYYNIVNG